MGKIFWANVDGQIESAQRSLNRMKVLFICISDEPAISGDWIPLLARVPAPGHGRWLLPFPGPDPSLFR